jgi:hypothetical protein
MGLCLKSYEPKLSGLDFYPFYWVHGPVNAMFQGGNGKQNPDEWGWDPSTLSPKPEEPFDDIFKCPFPFTYIYGFYDYDRH